MEKPLVIVGSGLAGYLLAKEFRQQNTTRDIILLTQTDGRFYSKPVLSTALAQQKTPAECVLSSAEEMSAKLSLNVITQATVTKIDPDKKIVFYEVQGRLQSQTYDQLALACGAEKIKPMLEMDLDSSLFSVNDIEDYELFRTNLVGKKKIVLLGAGFIGCEFANDLMQADYHVVVVAPETYPLSRLVPEPVGQALREAFEVHGIQWRLGESAVRVQSTGKDDQVMLKSGHIETADMVFSAVGIHPRIQLAKQAGLKVQHGIIVNEFLQTSDPFIYALGDCAEIDGRTYQFVAPLLQSARALAKTLSGVPTKLVFPVMPIVVKTPAYPITVVPATQGAEGSWQFEKSGSGIKGLYRDFKGHLLGFVLSGDAVKEKAQLAREIQLALK